MHKGGKFKLSFDIFNEKRGKHEKMIPNTKETIDNDIKMLKTCF